MRLVQSDKLLVHYPPTPQFRGFSASIPRSYSRSRKRPRLRMHISFLIPFGRLKRVVVRMSIHITRDSHTLTGYWIAQFSKKGVFPLRNNSEKNTHRPQPNSVSAVGLKRVEKYVINDSGENSNFYNQNCKQSENSELRWYFHLWTTFPIYWLFMRVVETNQATL